MLIQLALKLQMKALNWLFLGIMLCTIAACKERTVVRSMYWWRTHFTLSQTEQNFLENQQIKRLYVRLFDVDWVDGEIIPIGKLQVQNPHVASEIVPVVYIKNRVLQQLKSQNADALPQLAEQIDGLIERYQKVYFKTNFAHEIQIDCDWGVKEQEQYFLLLKALKKRQVHRTISVTLRLFPYKNAHLTGVPPADRAMLMLYHVAKFTDYNAKNSIYNSNDAAAYLRRASPYPIPVDIALPVFSWGVLFRYGKFEQLFNGLGHEEANRLGFLKRQGGFYRVQQDTVFRGTFLRIGDEIRVEQLSEEELFTAANQTAKILGQSQTHISLFHLDDTFLNHYPHASLGKIFDTFR